MLIGSLARVSFGPAGIPGGAQYAAHSSKLLLLEHAQSQPCPVACAQAEYNARCDPQHRMPRSASPEAEAEEAADCAAAGGGFGSSGAAPPPQQARPQAQGTDASGRPSQPYSFTKPEPERFVPNPGSSGGGAGGAAGAAKSASTSARAAGAAGHQPQADRGGSADAQGQGQAKAGKAQPRGGASGKPAAAEAKPRAAGGAGSNGGAQQQQQQQQPQPGAQPRNAGAGFRPDSKARGPPPGGRAAGSGGGAGPDADRGASPDHDDGGYGGRGASAAPPAERKWDWWFTGTMEALKSGLEPYAGPGVLGSAVQGLFYLVYISLTIPHVTISFLAGEVVRNGCGSCCSCRGRRAAAKRRCAVPAVAAPCA